MKFKVFDQNKHGLAEKISVIREGHPNAKVTYLFESDQPSALVEY